MPIYLNTGRQKILCDSVSLDKQSQRSSPPDQWEARAAVLVKTRHTLLTIVQKQNHLAKSSPALRVNEILPAVQLEETKSSPNGIEQVTRTLKLGKTRVVQVVSQARGPAGEFTRFELELMEVVLTAQQLSAFSSTTASDDWLNRV
jgi:hypothetical protein